MASSRTAKLINGRNAAGASPYFKNTFTCLLNPNKSANLVQELFLQKELNRWKLLVWHLAWYFQEWQLWHSLSLSMAAVGQKTKTIKHLMGNIEIISKLKYLSRKLEQEQEQSTSHQKVSKKRRSDPDIEYKRDEKDWWWCDDVWPIDCRIKSPHYCWWGFTLLVGLPGLKPGTKGWWEP